MSMLGHCRRYMQGLAVLALAACSSPDPAYYTLQPVAGRAFVGHSLAVEVARPGLAGYLDRSDIVLKQADYKLHVDSQVRWGEPLGDMIGRVLAQDLSQRLPGSNVFAAGGAIGADADYRVEVDIQRFDAAADGSVTLIAATAIERSLSHTPIAARPISLQATNISPGPASLAAAMSGLLGQLADAAAADLTR